MRITKIKILKNKVTVFLGKEKLELDKETSPNFYLYEGKELSKKELNQIKEFNNTAALLKYALRIRSKAIYSEYQIREKLYKKGGSKKEVDSVVKQMKSYDLIDDNAFISDYIDYFNSLNYGKNKILLKLSQKGIFEERLAKLNFPISEEKKKANALFPKLNKKYEKYNYSQKKDHIYKAYLDNGFDSDIASLMVSKVTPSSTKEENEKLKKDYEKAKLRLSRKYNGKELKQKITMSLIQKGYKINDIMKISERK